MIVWRKRGINWLIFVFLYFILAMISLETRDPWSLSSTVWLPAGLVLGTLCTSPRIYWPVWGVSAGSLHVLVSILYGRTMDVALTFALLDLAVLFPLAMMWHSAQHYFKHVSYRNGTLLLLGGVYVASILGGLLSILVLMLLNYPIILSHFFTWSLSNATGCLSSAPLFIARHLFKENRPKFSLLQIVALLGVISVFLLPPGLLHSMLLDQMLLCLVLGISLMLTVVWPLPVLTLYFLSLTLLVSLTTLYGYGPLAIEDQQDIQFSQFYLLMLISLGLLLAAQESTRKGHRKKQQQQLLLLSHLIQQQQPVFFQLSSDGSEISWLHSGSVFDIPTEQLPTRQLFLARIHPEDRAVFSASLDGVNASSTQIFRQSMLRLLLHDRHYHQVCCNLVYDSSQFGILGVLALSD